ncbi:MAG: FxsA family protein [Devosiaceae bacterium]|nr:FxsA family protein [Devosiaceae bacterium MH13]
MPFAIVFLALIFIEIAGFVGMAGAVGLLGVFGLIVLGFIGGGLIIRTIGLASVRRMQERAEAGETVGQELGGLVLGFLGGVLLILPGFFTDIIGLLLLIKPIQTLVWPRYGRQMASRMPDFGTPGGQGTWHSPGARRGPAQRDPQTVVIDAEVSDGPMSGDAASHHSADGAAPGPDGAPRGRAGDNPWSV